MGKPVDFKLSATKCLPTYRVAQSKPFVVLRKVNGSLSAARVVDNSQNLVNNLVAR